MRRGIPVYGVTTGYGKSCGKRMPLDIALKNGANILTFHGCGTGEPIGIEETRATMLCRIICLAKGYSGVSIALLQQLADFLNHGITPVVPCEGSVGASGDLTPMSYIGACLAGERDVIYRDKVMPAAKAMKKAGLKPYRLSAQRASGDGQRHNHDDGYRRFGCRMSMANSIRRDLRHGAFHSRPQGKRSALSSGNFGSETISRSDICRSSNYQSFKNKSIGAPTGR